jgi:Ni/Fe-hydrogenase subunit HybB-like protein
MTSDREAKVLRVLTETSWRFYAAFGFFAVVALFGLYAYITQLRRGLIVTGMRDEVSWGVYIANFVFFTGISYGGTLISAILRVTGSQWRHPITRLSEAITVFALSIGAPMVIVDLGRPDRMYNLFIHGRIQSPILWDVIAVSTYLAGCALYLYLPMIPDLALLADRQEFAPWRRKFYRWLSFGWTGTQPEQHLLEKCISRMAVLMIMLAVSVHTVVSWIFGMTLRPGWNSSIFGPYFVMAAIYSGTAAVILSMYILSRVLHLEDYLKPVHFRNLAMLLVTFSLLYLYFSINEYLTSAYKVEGPEKLLLHQLFFGEYAALMWVTQALFIFIPLLMLAAVLIVKKLRPATPSMVAFASVLIIVGSWTKRYLIVVPSLTDPYLQNQKLPFEWQHYHPTWVEWAVTFGGVAVFLLLYMLFTKLFPMISLWETRQDEPHADKQQVVEKSSQTAPGVPVLGGVPTLILLFICVLLGAPRAHADRKQPAKTPEATTLGLEWQTAASPGNGQEPNTTESQSGASLLQGLFGFKSSSNASAGSEPNPHTTVITATLRGANGEPLAYQVVSLSLKTSFGHLDYGDRPTNADGKAVFTLKDRRYGQYTVESAYPGGDKFATAHATASIDFGPRPKPALPASGVLITPYATPAIGIPFLIFFGGTWAVFLYIGVYLLFWRLPRLRDRQA